jgi:pentapeptide MXKDX repeat protein
VILHAISMKGTAKQAEESSHMKITAIVLSLALIAFLGGALAVNALSGDSGKSMKTESSMKSDKMMESEKMAADKMESEKMTADKMESEKMAADKMESEKMAADKMESEKMAADKDAMVGASK